MAQPDTAAGSLGSLVSLRSAESLLGYGVLGIWRVGVNEPYRLVAGGVHRRWREGVSVAAFGGLGVGISGRG